MTVSATPSALIAQNVSRSDAWISPSGNDA